MRLVNVLFSGGGSGGALVYLPSQSPLCHPGKPPPDLPSSDSVGLSALGFLVLTSVCVCVCEHSGA